MFLFSYLHIYLTKDKRTNYDFHNPIFSIVFHKNEESYTTGLFGYFSFILKIYNQQFKTTSLEKRSVCMSGMSIVISSQVM